MRKKLVVALLGLSATMLFTGCGVKQTEETIKWEAGQELTLEAQDFLDISDKKAEKVELDTSAVNVDKVGDYEVVAKYGKKEYVVKLVVEDTTAPQVEMKSHIIYTSDIGSATADESIDVVYDASKYEVTFMGYEKIAGLEVVNDEYVSGLENTINDLNTEGLVNEVPTEEGVYRSILKFVDKYENETLVEVHIIYDAPDPVVEETTTETNTTTQNGGSTNNSKGNGGSTTSNSGNKNNSSNKGTNSGSTNSGNTTTNNGSSNNSGSTNSGNTTNNGSTGLTGQGEPMTPAQQAAVNAGYYKVATSSKGYSVMVHGGEYEKGMKILEDYLATLGYERIGGSGAWINSANDQYGVYVDFDEIQKIETEDDIILNF